MRAGFALAVLSLLCSSAAALAGQTPRPADAKVYLISPNNGATVGPVFSVKFGLQNMGIGRAGENVPNVGHHHLLIDVDETQLDMNEPLPTTKNIKHYGT